MNQQDLTKLLFDLATKRAQKAGRHLGEGADQDLRNLIETGAKQLANIADRDEQEREIARAEDLLIGLIDDAISVASSIKGYPEDLLGEISYFPARLRFCPCRPFC